MSPDRSTQLSADPPKAKPYSKTTQPTAMEEITNTFTQRSPAASSRTELPTRAQYTQIEEAYINSLHPRRQGKALISQDLFERVWDVLAHNPENSTESAQFRFWARKKFILGYTGDTPIEETEERRPPPENAVLLHQNRIVAKREDIYDIICEKHIASNHGGRDKTASAIREEYVWLPKELIANFVKACPTCIYKKCGIGGSREHQRSPFVKAGTSSMSPPHVSPNEAQVQNNGYSPALASTPLFHSLGSPPLGSSENGRLLAHSPLPGSPMIEDSSPSQAYNGFAMLREKNWSAPAGIVQDLHGETPLPVPLRRERNHSAPAAGSSLRSGLHSLPMSREVSLYQGLPNGWQFQHRDYPSAHNAFTQHHEDISIDPVEPVPLPSSRRRRPRVPSLAPIIATPSQGGDESMCYVKEEPSEDFQQPHAEFSIQSEAHDLRSIALPLSQLEARAPLSQTFHQLGFSTVIPGTNPEIANAESPDFIEKFLRFKNNVLVADDDPSTPTHPALITTSPQTIPGTPGERTPVCGEQAKFSDSISSAAAAQFQMMPSELEELAEKMTTSVSLEDTGEKGNQTEDQMIVV